MAVVTPRRELLAAAGAEADRPAPAARRDGAGSAPLPRGP